MWGVKCGFLAIVQGKEVVEGLALSSYWDRFSEITCFFWPQYHAVNGTMHVKWVILRLILLLE